MTLAAGPVLPLPGMPPVPVRSLEQLALIGAPQPRDETRCASWLGGVSPTGRGSFLAVSLPGPSRGGTVPANLFAYQLEYGIIPRLGWSGTGDAVLCHQCAFDGCPNPRHLRLGTNALNRSEYHPRHRDLSRPLADVRGTAGHTRAVRTGPSKQEGLEVIEERVLAAGTAGSPQTFW
ncbi:hypothetical protein [Rhodococcus sp. WAY2]|uniref:hypothetical protein n=1 Tax=Rhodococcus sp. WAY2 TaxID=2663121 RepID=UPI00131FBD94|nr:hypothetical protein [Rhodococcus sp. WAY2]QHE73351.1 hypothetical protein GFS60_07010 [Rhodococcus sp. WAY2]